MGLNVVMIATYPIEPGVIVGGIESVTSTLVPALADQDEIDKLTVIRFHDGDAPIERRREGDKVEIRFVRGQRKLRTFTRSFLDVRRAKRIIDEVRPDVVHAQEIGLPADIATQCSRDVVATVHGLVHVEADMSAGAGARARFRARLIRQMVQRVLRRTKVVISISEYDTAALDGLVAGTRVGIPNPTAAEFFALADSAPTEPRLLFAGVLTPRKNALGLIEAFAAARRVVPQARLVVVGPQPDPEYAGRVRELAERLDLGDGIEFVGLVDNDRLRAEIAAARAVVMFSLEETAPTIIAQAMAAGKPVVASRVGGIPEMVHDGESGFLVASQDIDALAQRMVDVLEDPTLATKLGARGREIALDRYEPGAVARATVQAYQLITAPRQRKEQSQ